MERLGEWRITESGVVDQSNKLLHPLRLRLRVEEYAQ
jgi:hypothetical protein